MQAASGGAAGRKCSVELVERKSGIGVRWVLVGAKTKGGLVREESSDEEQTGRGCEYVVGGETNRSKGCGGAIPWLCASADPNEKWWVRLRKNPKRSGEVSQASFLLRVEMLGLNLALPWGDSERYDFVVWGRDGVRIVRVQVKATGRLHRRGYEVQPVHTSRGGKKRRYTKRDIDVIAAHVQPVDAWYLIPIEKVGRAKSLRLYPGIEGGNRTWEKYREAWGILGRR